MIYQKLFSTHKINNKVVKNRIVLPPMADFGMTKSDGLVNQRHLDHYQRIAKATTGTIIIEACAVTKLNEPRNTINIDNDSCINGLSKLAKAIHQYESLALVQIMNTGLKAMKENSLTDISINQLLKYKNDFIQAAKRCQKAGFDGVEIHGAHGMFINEIIETSQRNDQYGGSFENRIRFLIEIIKEIKQECTQDFIVGVRLGNSNLNELVLSSQACQNAGADFLDISTGLNDYYHKPDNFPFDDKIYAASTVKQAVTIPVIGVGNISEGMEAEEILMANMVDLVAVGRGQLCDPLWSQKVKNDLEVNKCLNCKRCLWYRDGRKCPAINLNKSKKMENNDENNSINW